MTVRLLPPPGAIILYSPAHQYTRPLNTSGVARYSIDFRTVHYDDLLTRRGARNVDSRCTGTTVRDYLRCTDLVHLPDDVVKLYNDGTEIEDLRPQFRRAAREAKAR